MRILLIPSSFYPVVGGLQNVVRNLGKFFCAQKHSVLVATNRYPRSLVHREAVEGIDVRRYTFLSPNIGYIFHFRLDLLLASLYFFLKTSIQLRKLIREYQPDIVNVHFPDNQIPFVLGLKRKFKFKLAVSLHGDDIRKIIEHRKFTRRKSFLKILEEADIVITPSRFLLERTAKLMPDVAKKIHVIHNGIDLELFQGKNAYQHGNPYILGLGRLTYKKGFDVLLEAFLQASKARPGIDLIIAGDGEKRAELEATALRLGLKEKVYFLGEALQEESIQLLKGCRLVVVPSREEPFGLVVIEAMAAGKTVIATDSGGPSELIQNRVNGILVEKENPDRLSDAIIRLIDNTGVNGKIAEEAARFAQGFSVDRMGNKYLDFFERLVA